MALAALALLEIWLSMQIQFMALGKLENTRGKIEIDATGLTLSPGFINMLSWANVSLLEDGRSQGDLRQGVTLEVPR